MTTTLTRPTFPPTLAVLALLITVGAGCSRESEGPEAQLRAWVDAMHQAAEAKDRGEIMERISESYLDGRGHSREDVENRLRVLFLRQQRVAFLPSIDEIRVHDGTAAEISITVGMAGTNNSALGIRADAYRFELELELEDNDWRLISARWGELGRSLR